MEPCSLIIHLNENNKKNLENIPPPPQKTREFLNPKNKPANIWKQLIVFSNLEVGRDLEDAKEAWNRRKNYDPLIASGKQVSETQDDLLDRYFD